MDDHEIVARIDQLAEEEHRLERAHVGEALSESEQQRLADLAPTTLALMHGPSFTGDCAGALKALADDYDVRVAAATGA